MKSFNERDPIPFSVDTPPNTFVSQIKNKNINIDTPSIDDNPLTQHRNTSGPQSYQYVNDHKIPLANSYPILNINSTQTLQSLSMLSLDEKDPIPFSAETPTIDTNINLLEPNLSIPQPHLSNADNDLDIMKNLRNKFKNNPGIGYLNINSLRGHKFHQLEQISEMCGLDILCIDETKLTPEIPTAKFRLKGYQYPPIRRDSL